MCVCVFVRFSMFQTPITHKRLEISIWNLVHQWSNHNPLIVTIFMTIDAGFVILWDFEFFRKKGCGSSNFRKIQAIFLKLHTNTLYRSRNFGIEFGTNPLKRSKFFKFWIFREFSWNRLSQANFDLSSWSFEHECTNTKWCLIQNFIRIGRDLYILDEFLFFIFFIVTSNYKDSKYQRSFLCEEAKMKQRTSLRMFDCGIRVKNAIQINFITAVTNHLHY